MTIETLIIIAGVVLIFLTYQKLSKLMKLFEVYKNVKDEFEKEKKKSNDNKVHWLYEIREELKTIKGKTTELSDVLTTENPAWGSNSAAAKKKDNLINLYSQYLAEKQKLSQKDALCKALFVINNFKGDIIADINRNMQSQVSQVNEKSEENFLHSDFFQKELREKADTIRQKELYEPLYLAIVKKKYKKGDKLIQNTRRAFESYSGEYCYECFVKDAAIIYRLEQLGLFKRITELDENTFQNNQDRTILGVSYNASINEIKDAHVKLAKQYHPDGEGGDLEQYSKINVAYKNLSQKDKASKTLRGHCYYILVEDNIDKIGCIIFSDSKFNQHNEYYAVTYDENKNMDIPFMTEYEFLFH